MFCDTAIDATFMAAANTADVLPLPLLQCYTVTATDAAGMLLIPLMCYRRLCSCNIIPPPHLMLLVACYCWMLPLPLLLWSSTTDNTAVAMIIPPPSHRCHSCCDATNQWCRGRGGRGEWDVCVDEYSERAEKGCKTKSKKLLNRNWVLKARDTHHGWKAEPGSNKKQLKCLRNSHM